MQKDCNVCFQYLKSLCFHQFMLIPIDQRCLSEIGVNELDITCRSKQCNTHAIKLPKLL